MTAKTTTERQKSRQNKLNQIAQGAGYETWTKLETDIIKKGKIEMNAKNIESLAWEIYSIVSGADNKQEMHETLSAIEDWLNEGDLSDNPNASKLAEEFKEFYYI